MLVTNILLGIIIVLLFIISERLTDFYYNSDEPTITTSVMTPEELKEFLNKLNDRED